MRKYQRSIFIPNLQVIVIMHSMTLCYDFITSDRNTNLVHIRYVFGFFFRFFSCFLMVHPHSRICCLEYRSLAIPRVEGVTWRNGGQWWSWIFNRCSCIAPQRSPTVKSQYACKEGVRCSYLFVFRSLPPNHFLRLRLVEGRSGSGEKGTSDCNTLLV